jgi:Flp pilus assembly protein TadG
MSRLADLLHRFRKDERGVFLVVFAVLGLVLIATSGAVVDFTRIQQARTKAQTALDAAALALSGQVGKTGVTADTLKAQAQLLLTERVADTTVTATVETAVPDKENGKLTLTASVIIPTYFVQLVGVKSVKANMLSEVTRSSHNLEVAVAADLTYSMTGSVTCAVGETGPCTRLTALKSALATTIDLLVQADQSPTYSKMAIAPYSNGVNVGTFADEVRGAIIGGKTISNVTGTSGSIRTISAISKANPAVVTTTANHGFANGDFIYVGGVAGGQFTGIAEGIYKVSPNGTSLNSFKLLKADGTNFSTSGYSGTYTSNSGKVVKCANSTCKVVSSTTTSHGFENTDIVLIKSSGATYFNDKYIEVSEKTSSTFVPKGVSPLTANIMGTGGTAYCTKYGCQYYRFTNSNNTFTTVEPTECAVERTTETNAYLDTSPMTAPVGIQYAPSNGVYYSGYPTLEACPTSAIQPLTSNIDTLKALVTGFQPQGSTAGHIGLAWAWYMLSPDFTGGVPSWPTSPISAKPAAYLDDDTVKVIILMTDGEFNTMYDYGVPSENAAFVDSSKKSTNNAFKTSLEQAEELCLEIKKAKYGITIYTIGFGISAGSPGDTMLSECASDTTKYKTASDSATLTAAFQEIADELSNLRVSK